MTDIMINNLIEIKVRGYHLDVYGHVNNARYLEFLEEARWTLFENELHVWQSMGVSFFVVNININYRAPALLNTTIQIQSRMTKMNSRSCVLNQTLTDTSTGTVLADADVTFVIVDGSGKAMRLTQEVLDNLQKFQ